MLSYLNLSPMASGSKPASPAPATPPLFTSTCTDDAKDVRKLKRVGPMGVDTAKDNESNCV